MLRNTIHLLHSINTEFPRFFTTYILTKICGVHGYVFMMTLCCFCDCLLLIVKAADGLRDTQRAKEKRGTSKAAASSRAADWEKAGALAALLTYTLRLRPWKVHSGYSTHPPPSLQIAVGGSGFVSKLLTLSSTRFFTQYLPHWPLSRLYQFITQWSWVAQFSRQICRISTGEGKSRLSTLKEMNHYVW